MRSRHLLALLLALAAASAAPTAQTTVRDSVLMTRKVYSWYRTEGGGVQCGAYLYATWPDVLLDLGLPGGHSRYSRVAVGGTSAHYVPYGGPATNDPSINLIVPEGFLAYDPNLGSHAAGPSDDGTCARFLALAQSATYNGPMSGLNGGPFQLTDWYAVFTVPSGTPVALFEWDQRRGLDVEFDGSFESRQSHEADATAPGGRRAADDAPWDCGAGHSGTGARPSHTYEDAGTYTVALTVTDDDGERSTHRETIPVRGGVLSVEVWTERTPLATGDTLSLVATVTNTGDEALYSIVADRVFVFDPDYPGIANVYGNYFIAPTLTALETGKVTQGSLEVGASFEVRQRYRVAASGTVRLAGTTPFVPTLTVLASTLSNVRAETSSGEAATVADACDDGGCANETTVKADGPELVRRLEVEPAEIHARDTLTVRLVVRNSGTTDLIDVVPGEVPFAQDVDFSPYDEARSTAPSLAVVGDGFEPASVASLAKGESATFTARLRITRPALWSNPDGGDFEPIASTVTLRPGGGAQAMHEGNAVVAGYDCDGDPCDVDVRVLPRDLRLVLAASLASGPVEDGGAVLAGLTYAPEAERAAFYSWAEGGNSGACVSGCVRLDVEVTDGDEPAVDETVRLRVPEVAASETVTARPHGNWLVAPTTQTGGEPAVDDGTWLDVTTDADGKAHAFYFTPGVTESVEVELLARVESDDPDVGDDVEETLAIRIEPNEPVQVAFDADPVTVAYLRTLASVIQTAGTANSVSDYCENGVKWIRANAPLIGDGALDGGGSLRRNSTLYLSNLGVNVACGFLVKKLSTAIRGAGPDLNEFTLADLYASSRRGTFADLFGDIDGGSGVVKKFAQSHLFLYVLYEADLGGRLLGVALPSPEEPPVFASFQGDFFDTALNNLASVMSAAPAGASYQIAVDFAEISALDASADLTQADALLGSTMRFTPTGGGGAEQTFRDRSRYLYLPDVFLDTEPDPLTWIQEAVTTIGGGIPAAVGEATVSAFDGISETLTGAVVQLGEGIESEINQILAVTAAPGRLADGASETVTLTFAAPTLYAYPEGAPIRVLAQGAAGTPTAPIPMPTFRPAERVRLEWMPGVAVASTFDVEIASDSAFATVVYRVTGTDSLAVEVTDAQVARDQVLYWHVRATNAVGAGPWSAWLPILVNDQPTAGEGRPEAAPASVALGAPFPNPTGHTATVSVELPEAGLVRLGVFDALGRRLAVAFDGSLPAGRHTIPLDAASLPAGVYVIRLEAGGEARAQRLTIVR